jgi:hypothetical protein
MCHAFPAESGKHMGVPKKLGINYSTSIGSTLKLHIFPAKLPCPTQPLGLWLSAIIPATCEVKPVLCSDASVGQGLLQGALNEKWEIMEKSLGLRK